MPSHQTPPSVVRATLVKIVFLARVAMALGFVFAEVPGATPKKPASGLSSPQAALRVWQNPSNIVTDGPDLPTLLLQVGRRNKHGEVGFATGARKSRRDVGLFAFRVFDSEDEHVLSHPTLLAANARGDPQGEAFFTSRALPP